VIGDLAGEDLLDDLRQLLEHPVVDCLANPGRQVVPKLCVLALHDPVDDVTDVLAGDGDHVLGDRLGLELLVEVARRPELRDPLVDRDAAHLRRPVGDDPLPADAAVHDAGDLL
jgi:hypothetical protein